VTDKAAQEAGFGRVERNNDFSLDDILNIKGIDTTGMSRRQEKKTRSFSLGGDENKMKKNVFQRYNSPRAERRHSNMYPSINIGTLGKSSSNNL